MRSIEVTLGGEKYQIHELKARANKEWRGQLKEIFSELADLLGSAGGAELTADAVTGLINQASDLLLESIDKVAELLFAYAPALEADRERILDEAYDSEILDAFVGVLGMAFPFGKLARQLLSLGSIAR